MATTKRDDVIQVLESEEHQGSLSAGEVRLHLESGEVVRLGGKYEYMNEGIRVADRLVPYTDIAAIYGSSGRLFPKSKSLRFES